MNKFLPLISLLVILSGCALTTNSPHYFPEDTLEFKLNSPIVVPAKSSYAYVRDGEVVRRGEIGTFDDYCKLLVAHDKNGGDVTIQPAVFKIHNAYQRVTARPVLLTEATQIASLELARFSGGLGGTSRRNLILQFELAGADHSPVRSISCVRFADSLPHNRLTLSDAQNIFRGLGEFTTGDPQ